MNLSEKRKRIIEILDSSKTWNNGTRRYLVKNVLEEVEYQDKQAVQELKEYILEVDKLERLALIRKINHTFGDKLI